MSGIPIQSFRFPGVLVVAAIVGWLVGSWLASVGKESAAAPSPSASAISVASPAPFISPSPSSATPAPPGATILEMSGAGDMKGQSFAVTPGWQIVWQTQGQRFEFAVRGDQDLGRIVKQAGPASGATSLPTAGTFHVEVTATGPWSLKVLQGEAPSTPAPTPTSS